MVAYSFKGRFVDAIRSRRKHQTIRGQRGGQGHVKPGGAVQLFTAMRTKACRRIGESVCLSVDPVLLVLATSSTPVVAASVRIGGQPDIRSNHSLDAFARRDGFLDWDDMRVFWMAEHPGLATFAGWLIVWDPERFVDRWDA